MRRGIQGVVAAVAVAIAAPATAQVKVRDHREKKPVRFSVQGFSPTSGPVGTEVTIRGRGFSPDTEVFVGGRPVRAEAVRPTSLRITIPRAAGNGDIVLRHPGVARDLRAGRFTIERDLRISRVAPLEGHPGTRVEIRGRALDGVDQVLLAGTPLRIVRSSATRLIVVVSDGAATGYVEVVRGGERARSTRKFNVLMPAPAIDRLEPTGGPGGETVRIHGKNFGRADRVFYGEREMAVVARGRDHIDAVIPQNAGADRFVVLTGRHGEARSPARFRLEQPPVIDRITPTAGLAGDQIEVYGRNFRAGDRLTLSGRPVRIIQLRAGHISVRVPPGARSGAFVLVRGDRQVAAPQPFDVLHAPIITDVSPAGGAAGTKVTITGRHLGGADVFYGAARVRVVERRGRGRLVVRVPRRASDQRFTVRTRGGDATTAEAFRVHTYPVVARVAPERGFVGTRVILRGRHMRFVDSVFLGRAELPIVDRGRRHVAVEVARGARSGPITVESFGREVTTRFRFDVHVTPELHDFSPRPAPVGGEVTVRGAGFTRDTEILFGRTPAEVVARKLPDELVVRVPQRAAGARYLWAHELDAEVRSTRKLTIIDAPAITRFTPRRAKAGAEVTITGEHFSRTTEVYVGGRLADVARRERDRVIVIRVPDGVKKPKPYIWVREHNAEGRSARPFDVLPSAQIARMRPSHARPGDEVTLVGRGFDRDTRVFWGRVELRVVGVARHGRSLVVALPDRLSGENPVIVDDFGYRSESRDLLVVDAPEDEPPPRVKVRDHRRRRRR